MVPGPGGINLYMVYTYFEHPTRLAHGVLGIGAQVHEHLVYLSRIGRHHASVLVEHVSYLDVGGERSAQQPQGFLDQQGELDWLARLPSSATEGENLLHQFLGPSAGAEHPVEMAPWRTVRGDVVEGEIGEAVYRREDIVKVVGNATCQDANGFHLLGLVELVFQTCAFGHVAARGSNPSDCFFRIAYGRQGEAEAACVACFCAVLERMRFRGMMLQYVRTALRDLLLCCGGKDGSQGFSQHVWAGTSEQCLGSAVAKTDALF